VQLNGESLPTTPSPGSYLVLTRSWKSGDRVSINLPMHLRFEPMPDDRNTRAVMYGPLLLAARLGSNGLTLGMIYGPMGPDVRHHPTDLPSVPASANDPNALLKGRGTHPLEFHTEGLPRELEFAPLIQISGERYLVYLSFT
jgi:DUF1680 family protein